MKFEIKGKHNLGLQREETLKVEVKQKENCIQISVNGEFRVSFNPFFDGGHVLIKDCCVAFENEKSFDTIHEYDVKELKELREFKDNLDNVLIDLGLKNGIR